MPRRKCATNCWPRRSRNSVEIAHSVCVRQICRNPADGQTNLFVSEPGFGSVSCCSSGRDFGYFMREHETKRASSERSNSAHRATYLSHRVVVSSALRSSSDSAVATARRAVAVPFTPRRRVRAPWPAVRRPCRAGRRARLRRGQFFLFVSGVRASRVRRRPRCETRAPPAR